MRASTYDKFPVVSIRESKGACVAGWTEVAGRLAECIEARPNERTVVVVDCYPGVDQEEIAQALRPLFKPDLVLRSEDALKPEAEIERLCAPFLGGDDPVFGYLSPIKLQDFFDAGKVQDLSNRIPQQAKAVLVLGVGAALVHPGDVLVYADLARWEIQQRQRRKQIGNLGIRNASAPANLKYKRAFFIDWRAADRWKKTLFKRIDFWLDTNKAGQPKLARGESVRAALTSTAQRPFRVVPFFDPGPWGGQWMKEVCDLDRSVINYAWCFDCVPEENSLLLGFGEHQMELPAIDLVFQEPRSLLGDPVHARFGDEFPIRFDFLDTMGGGNLSFQVHPLTEYIQQKFGMHYTQDESYYLLDAGPDACVYLGLKDGANPAEFVADLKLAQAGGPPFPDHKYVNRWPAKKHDHFLIPAGTCHCSGKDSMVLEISATPYIFTFKMWDWGRLGLDGKPRPIHLDHGIANVQWDRTTEWVERGLINPIEPLGQGPGWREERTGLHPREFIETRRHWFTAPVQHHTGGMERGSVNVLNLVQGEQAIVESPSHAFDPFVVHYAETFIVPAAVGPYTIRPHGAQNECATLKALVR